MGDLLIRAGFEVGSNELKRAVELDPFETGYDSTRLFVEYDPDWFDKMGLSPAVGFGLAYARLRGDEGNFGSSRDQLEGYVFGQVRPLSWLYAKLQAGAGIGNSQFNFGRGVPLEDETTLGLQLGLTGGVSIPLSSSVSLLAGGGYMLETATVNSIGYLNRGPVGGLTLAFGLADSVKPEPEKIYVEKEVPKYIEVEKDCPEPQPCPPQVTCPPPVKCPTPHVDKPTRFLSVFGINDTILFPNLNPNLELSPQWFPSQNKGRVQCWVNPTLDNIILTLKDWIAKAKKMDRINGEERPSIQISLYITGYANDVGIVDQNQKLARARAQSVIDYLTQRGAIDYIGDVAESAGAARSRRAEVGSALQKETCGAFDAMGNKIGVLLEGDTRDYLKIFNLNDSKNAAIKRVREAEYDPMQSLNAKSPAYRRVRIEIEVYQGDKKVEGDELEQLKRKLWGGIDE